MRLQKFLSRAGIASRRRSEILIREGRVNVDGTVASLGTSIDPTSQVVEFDGKVVRLRQTAWLVLHKPPGYVCTRQDPRSRPTVYDLIPEEYGHLPHVGRLDFWSEGLLLLSNDGDLVHRILHPRSGLPRHYEVTVDGPRPDNLPGTLKEGVELDDGPARAAASRWVGPGTLEVVLREGRNREIRRMFRTLGVGIRRLRRTALGPILLEDLEPGHVRALTQAEIAQLASAVSSGC